MLWGYSRALIEPDRLTIGRMPQERGYHTAGVGKWHLGKGKNGIVRYIRKEVEAYEASREV